MLKNIWWIGHDKMLAALLQQQWPNVMILYPKFGLTFGTHTPTNHWWANLYGDVANFKTFFGVYWIEKMAKIQLHSIALTPKTPFSADEGEHFSQHYCIHVYKS